MLIGGDVEHAALRIAELQEVQRGEIAGGVVEEHIFRAGIRRDDRPRGGAGVPVVDRRMILDAGIGGRPGGMADLFPQIAGLQGLGHLAVGAPRELPIGIVLDGAQELVGHPHTIVGILAGDGEIGVRIPVRRVGVELDILVTLARELDDALDVIVRHRIAPGELDRLLQRRVLFGIEAIVARPLAIDAGAQHRLDMAAHDLRAGNEGCDLFLFLDLPIDEGFDVGMVGVDDDHFGGAARRAAGFDGAGSAIADLQEGHQARRFAAAREPFVLAAQLREVRAGAGAVFEQARFAHPQIHDAAVVDEIVLDFLDETGMRLRMFVGGLRLGELSGRVIDVIMALARAIDPIGPVQAGVEPLRRIGRGDLPGEHVTELVEEGLRIGLGVEIFALAAPIGPGAGESVENIGGGTFRPIALGLRQALECSLVGDRAPQEGGNIRLFDLGQAGGYAGLTEIFLGEHVGGDLAPGRRHVDIVLGEDDGAIRITDFALRLAELDLCVGRLTCLGIKSVDPHVFIPLYRGTSPLEAAGAAPALV